MWDYDVGFVIVSAVVACIGRELCVVLYHCLCLIKDALCDCVYTCHNGMTVYGWCALAPAIPILIGARSMLDTIITGDSGEVPATVNVCVTHWMIFMMPGREL